MAEGWNLTSIAEFLTTPAVALPAAASHVRAWSRMSDIDAAAQ
jgi:hypothetical protein